MIGDNLIDGLYLFIFYKYIVSSESRENIVQLLPNLTMWTLFIRLGCSAFARPPIVTFAVTSTIIKAYIGRYHKHIKHSLHEIAEELLYILLFKLLLVVIDGVIKLLQYGVMDIILANAVIYSYQAIDWILLYPICRLILNYFMSKAK